MFPGNAAQLAVRLSIRDFLNGDDFVPEIIEPTPMEPPAPRLTHEFDGKAVEIAVFDRHGNPVWRQRNTRTSGPIRWAGVDLAGRVVEAGNYICKYIYPDGGITYTPFVLSK